jgi:DNA-binding transcriptional LysR family regulator
METLQNLESFVRSAEEGSFSAAGRRMSITAAAVSRNVAVLERNLGMRLFQRSTRKLTLTEGGERLLTGVRGKLEELSKAITDVTAGGQEPSGALKVSLPTTIGMDYILPLLPAFLARYPAVTVDWRFTNRQVDLVGEGFEVAIGGGFELSPSITARTLAPLHIVAVASPSYMAGRPPPATPDDLFALSGILMRSDTNGRIRNWMMRNRQGREVAARMNPVTVVNDPAPMVKAALLGMGTALVAVPDVARHLESGELVRLLPQWYADAGAIRLYHSGRALRPAKISVFVEHVFEHFKRERLAEKFAGSLG